MSGRATRSTPGPSPRAGGDDGAVLVEAVMILPILIALWCGLVDFGVGLRDRQLIQAASRNGARVAASSANYNALATSDRYAMSTVWAALQRVQNVTIQRVVIFRANPSTWTSQSTVPLTAIPSVCATTATNNTGAGVATTAAVCNIYSLTQVQNAASTWVSSYNSSTNTCSASTGYDRWWCPGTRAATLSGNSGRGPDYLGVYVEVSYTTFTGFFLRTLTMYDTTIVRLEPTA